MRLLGGLLRVLIVGGICGLVFFVAWSEYMRNKRMHEPCVVYHPGMTLLPGQCAKGTITIQRPQKPATMMEPRNDKPTI